MTQINVTLRDLLASSITAMGFEFVGGELRSAGRQFLLRIYIDSPNKVTIDDCSKVSRQVSALLDVEDPIQGRYTLEVSSPGLDRPLFEIEQYQKFIGSRIKIRVYDPIEGRRNFAGVLLKIENRDIHLLQDEEEIVLPFSSIEKANVIADIRSN